MHVIQRTKEGVVSLPAKELTPKEIKSTTSPLAKAILEKLALKEDYPRNLAKELNLNEQKIYYHIRKLEKSKVVEVSKTKYIGGAKTNFYKLTEPAFVVKFKDFETAQNIGELEERPKSFLEPFIDDGQLNARIIVGSPDPHGPERARSRDGYYGIDLALFLGTFLNYLPTTNVMLDTEAKEEDLQNNLIIIGGPVINSVAEKINNSLPIFFEKESHWDIKSDISKKTYGSDETGIIVKAKSPFNPKKQVLLIAGKRYAGTKAVMIAFIRYFKEIIKGNKFDEKILAKVVEGIDLDSDGIVDDVEILE